MKSDSLPIEVVLLENVEYNSNIPITGGLRMTEADGGDQMFENGKKCERERILAIIRKVRAEAISHASNAWGSGSEGPENEGRWRACDTIVAEILSKV